MRFIRFQGDIFNVDTLIRVWEKRTVRSDGTEVWHTHITQQNGAEHTTNLEYRGQHADQIWALIEECARLENETIQPTVVQKKRNILVDSVLEG